jgi:hypothetical protein
MEVIIINLETDFTENWIDMSYECLGIKSTNGIPLGKIVQPVISAAFTLNIC